MYITTKCLYLRPEISGEQLIQFGFKTLNNGKSYWLDLNNLFDMIGWYADTRRLVFKFPRRTDAKYVSQFLSEEILKLTYVRRTVEHLTIFGSWHNYSEKKLNRIKQKCATKQAALDLKL